MLKTLAGFVTEIVLMKPGFSDFFGFLSEILYYSGRMESSVCEEPFM